MGEPPRVPTGSPLFSPARPPCSEERKVCVADLVWCGTVTQCGAVADLFVSRANFQSRLLPFLFCSSHRLTCREKRAHSHTHRSAQSQSQSTTAIRAIRLPRHVHSLPFLCVLVLYRLADMLLNLLTSIHACTHNTSSNCAYVHRYINSSIHFYYFFKQYLGQN